MRDHLFGRRMRRTISRTTTRFRRIDRSHHLEPNLDHVDRLAGDRLVSSSHVLRGLR